LVDLVPVVRVNGAEVVRGSPIVMGSIQTRRIIITTASGTVQTADNSVSAGGVFCVGLGYGRSSLKSVAAAQARLTAAGDALPKTASGIRDVNDPGNLSEPVIGETLNMMMQTWFSRVETSSELIARSLGVRWVRGPSAGVASQPVLISYFFGVPFGTSGGGLFFDIQFDEIAAASLKNSPRDVVAFMETTGMISSALEHSTIELLGYRSLSTMRVLSQALQQGATIYRIDNSNRAAAMMNLGGVLSSIDKSTINAALDAGNVVTVPDEQVHLGSWSGTGYMITNPDTGSGGFIISGGLSGELGAVSGGTLITALQTVAAYALADVSILLNAYLLTASASALLLAPEITLVGALLPLLAVIGLAASISSLEGLALGTVSAPQYVVQTLAGLLVGTALSYGLSVALNLGESGILGLGPGGVPTSFAELDAATNNWASTLVSKGLSQDQVMLLGMNGLNTADDLSNVSTVVQAFDPAVVSKLIDKATTSGFGNASAADVFGSISEALNRNPSAVGLEETVKNIANNADALPFVNELRLPDFLIANGFESGPQAVTGYNPQLELTTGAPTVIVANNRIVGLDYSNLQTVLKADLATNQGTPGETWYEIKTGATDGLRVGTALANQILKDQQAMINQQGPNFRVVVDEPLISDLQNLAAGLDPANPTGPPVRPPVTVIVRKP
jgi:hypothetical protein